MKAIKALRRLEKAEALMSVVIERYTVSDESVQQVLRAAKTSLVRAQEVVKAQAAALKKTGANKRAAKKATAHKPAPGAGAGDGAGKGGARRAASKAQTNGAKSPQQAMAAAG